MAGSSLADRLRGGFRCLWGGAAKNGKPSEKEPVRDSGGCSGCASACRIYAGAPVDSQVPEPAVLVVTKQDAIDESLRNLLRVLEKPYGADIKCIPEKACELVKMGASGAIVDEIAIFYLRHGEWKSALKIVTAAKRNFTENEKETTFAILAANGSLTEFFLMAKAVGFPPKSVIIRAVSYAYLTSQCWPDFYNIVEKNPDQDIVDAALDTCCKRGYDAMALKIAKFPCSPEKKEKVAAVVFEKGSLEEARAAVLQLFGREDLEPQEIMAVSSAMAKIADQKREDHRSSAESED